MSGPSVKQWEKASTGSGVVYYVNHTDKKNQWDHPNYQVMMEMLDDCNSIKYAAYRTAAKLCVLQRFFSMSQVPLKIIAGVFDKHQMRSTENNVELSSGELEDIVYDILFASHTSTTQSLMNVDLNTELILNFLLSVFDCARRKSVKVLSAKVVLTILSASSMQSKIIYLFQQLSDHNQCVSKRKMEAFLHICACLMQYLAESIAFSPNLIKPTLKSCFHGNEKFVGLTEDAFVRWFLSEPRVILWFPIFYRLKTAENEIHSVACSSCKAQPIRGLRYKCLRCLSYDQCQQCFFTRRVSRRHKLRHPMQEYCWQCSSQASLTSMKPDSELSSIIGLLENENKRLEREMKHVDSEYLREHKDQIRTQIQRLRKVKTHIHLLCSQPKLPVARMQSTPMLRGPALAPSFENLLSPIAASDTSTSGVSMSPQGSWQPSQNSQATVGDRGTFSSDGGNSEMFPSLGASNLSLNSRVGVDNISTWIGKRNLSHPSSLNFDFSALLCPKQVSASYHVINESDREDEKENEGEIGASGKKKQRSKGKSNEEKENGIEFDSSEKKKGKKSGERFQSLDNCEFEANSSFSLDEVLAQYECDSRFSTNTSKTQSFLQKTKSLFDLRKNKSPNAGGKQKPERLALSTLNLEENIPCNGLRNGSYSRHSRDTFSREIIARDLNSKEITSGHSSREISARENTSRLSYVSCVSRDSLLSSHTLLSTASCDEVHKSMGSEDYLESIRKTCSDMYTPLGTERDGLSFEERSKNPATIDFSIGEENSKNLSTRANFSSTLLQRGNESHVRGNFPSEQRSTNRLTACPDRIRRRQTSGTPSWRETSGEISSQTLPRMFRTPAQATHRNSGNYSRDYSLPFEQKSPDSQIGDQGSIVNARRVVATMAPNKRPKSSESLSSAYQMGRRNTSASNSHKDLTRISQELRTMSTSSSDVRSKRGTLCDSLNSLLSQEGGIESSLLELRDVSVQDGQLLQVQEEIDSILAKLRTILANV